MALGDLVPWDTIRSAIDAWFAALGVRVMYANQGTNPPSRTRPYCVVKVAGMQEMGRRARRNHLQSDNVTQIVETLGQDLMSLQIEAVTDATGVLGNDAVALANSVRNSIQVPTIKDILHTVLGYSNASEVLDISAVEGAQPVSRAVFVAYFGVGLSDYPGGGVAGDTIGTVIGSGDITPDNPDEIIHVDFDVSG